MAKKKPTKDNKDWLEQSHTGGTAELGPISDAIGELAAKKRGVKAIPLLTGEAAHTKVVQVAYAAWDGAQIEAQKRYDTACHAAWLRYATALKAHGSKPSAKAAFSIQYDKDKETALKVWQETTNRADKKLQSALDAAGGDVVEEEEFIAEK